MPCSATAIPWSRSDNLLTGRLANLDHLRNDSRFELQQIDINEPFDCGEVDYVFHFACPASPVDYTVHGIATLKVGSLGTFHALDIARKYGAKYFVSSTSECYGDPLEHPQKETYWGNVNPIGPRSVYDEARDLPKRSPWPITAITKWTPASSESSILTARACSSTTAGSFRTS